MPSRSNCDPTATLFPYLRGHIESMALQPVTLQGCYFPGLNESLEALQGERVLFWGDSTVYSLAIAVEMLHRVRRRDEGLSILANVTGAGNYTGVIEEYWEKKMVFWLRQSKLRNPFSVSFRAQPFAADRNFSGSASGRMTHISFHNGQNSTSRYTGRSCDPKLQSSLRYALERTRPTILIYQWGAHWWHSFGFGKFAPYPCAVRHWLNYEEFVVGNARMAAAHGVRLILHKTVNRVCERKFTENRTLNWLERHRVNNTDPLLYAPCIARLAGPDHQLEALEVRRFCMNGSFSQRGSLNLNERSAAAIASAGWSDGKRKLLEFDDHGLTRCEYASDELHQKELLLMRVRALANLIAWAKVQEVDGVKRRLNA